MIFLLAILIALQWDTNREPDIVGYRVYRRSSDALDFGGWFTNFVQVVQNHFEEDVPENVYHYRCLTAINSSGMESEPCPAIWIYFPRDRKDPKETVPWLRWMTF